MRGQKRESPVLWLIIPCYNEEKVLPIMAPVFLAKLQSLIATGRIDEESRILFINDGSSDGTWAIITALAGVDAHYVGISQSRNRGHQNAVLAGLMEAKDRCDITVSMDCDGQDDVNALDQMLEEYAGGCEVVYGVRSNRDSDSWFKRSTAQGFYKFLNFMGVEVVYNHADYRLVSSRVLQHLAEFKEVNIFLRGMIPLVGFKSTSVFYERHSRMAGESHYPLSKMMALAFDGITSLSIKPISMIAGLGAVIGVGGFLGILWAVLGAMMGSTVTGWASMLCVICFLGGIQLISLSIIGEYVGKAYMESKHRPRYIISERTYLSPDDRDGPCLEVKHG